MRTETDVNRLYTSLLKDVRQNGEIKAKRRERIFVPMTITNMDKNVLFFPFAQRNWPWILREASDRIFGKYNPGTAYHYSKNWENRIEENGYFSYHYADRLGEQMQEMLSKRKQSRDKVITVWERGDYSLDGRQPCTIMMQPIMEHDDKMSLVVYMRNNDIVNIFPSDIFIHSTYFKYWAIKNDIEYKNLYWIAAVAYYQKKRDELEFIDRLLDSWENDYDTLGIEPHHWDKNTIEDLEYKEELENSKIWNSKFENVTDALSKFTTDYVRDWFKIMLLANFKANKEKEKFSQIYATQFNSEFAKIRDSIVSPK
jgi:thymidylate synthase